jgi:hypothetical protein
LFLDAEVNMKAVYLYFHSRSARIALLVGTLMYVSYAYAHESWTNPALIGVTVFVAGFLPFYSRLSNKIEEKANFYTALISAGRVARFAIQLVFNYAIFLAFVMGGVFDAEMLNGLGGILGVAVVTTLASQGAQYLAIICFNRNVGDLNRNVLLGVSANVVVTALATAGLAWAKPAFLVFGLGLGAIVFAVGVLSDLRGFFYPREGIGIFFGTFNPFHSTHMDIVRHALVERDLDKVVIHPTVVPKLHAQALERGEIKIDRVENGMVVYGRMAKADPNVNYFPTGNRFYPPQTRKLLIELAVAEAGLAGRVEVAFYPEIYRDHGFQGVIREIRRRNPGRVLHALHGSDLGGMWVRNICDECGWIYPFAVRRTDGVSATAIRNGALGMTSALVGDVLAQLRAGTRVLEVANRRYQNDNGLLIAA